MNEDATCAAISAARDEAAWATASRVTRWLMVEQPGAWGADALTESRLPPEVAAHLVSLKRAGGIRPLVVRQPDRPRHGDRHAFAAFSGRPDPWVSHRHIDDPADLLTADPTEAAAFGDPWLQPLYLVCTNGKHDPCCARLGRPVVRDLLKRRPEQVWESSHIGGDRFAGNLVCFPHGLYFGRLDPPAARNVVAAYEDGHIDLDHFRGRAGDPYPVQAAEYHVRRRDRLTAIDAVTPTGRRRLDRGRIEVTLTLADGSITTVVVDTGTAADPRLLTCAAPDERRPPAYAIHGPEAGPAVH